MNPIDTSRWSYIGESSNTKYYFISEDVIGALPNDGAIDTEQTARENVAFQMNHFRKRGHGGVTVVFADALSSQDKGARRVYQTEPDPAVMLGTALVGNTLLGRAIVSFFLGISRPRIPVRLCASLEQALTWAGTVVAAHKRSTP